LICGPTGAAKGDSLTVAEDLVKGIAPGNGWHNDHHLTGLSSGEAFVHRLAELDQPKGDIRKLIVEQEFSRVLKVAARDNSTVSEMMRCLFDGSRIANQVKKQAESAECKRHYVSIIGHVTPEALTDGVARASYISDGSLNRFLVVASKRARKIPTDEPYPLAVQREIADIQSELSGAFRSALTTGHLIRTDAAAADWRDRLYDQLTPDDVFGPMAQMIARAKPIVLRLSQIYALADGADAIDLPHQRAAEALWIYGRLSLRYIFEPSARRDGSTTGSSDADRLIAALKDAGADGMNRGQIYALFNNKRRRDEVDRMAAILVDTDRAIERDEPRQDRRAGRPNLVLYHADHVPAARSR
jgi:Protein of unknown function (DUF3987)